MGVRRLSYLHNPSCRMCVFTCYMGNNNKKKVLHVYKVQTHNCTFSFDKPEASLGDRRTLLEDTSEDNIFMELFWGHKAAKGDQK